MLQFLSNLKGKVVWSLPSDIWPGGSYSTPCLHFPCCSLSQACVCARVWRRVTPVSSSCRWTSTSSGCGQKTTPSGNRASTTPSRTGPSPQLLKSHQGSSSKTHICRQHPFFLDKLIIKIFLACFQCSKVYQEKKEKGKVLSIDILHKYHWKFRIFDTFLGAPQSNSIKVVYSKWEHIQIQRHGKLDSHGNLSWFLPVP